jgi:hypothetical protein
MRNLLIIPLIILVFASCDNMRRSGNVLYSSADGREYAAYNNDPITQSLFNDKSASISEENIQKILDGSVKTPEKLRVAVIRIDQQERRYYWNNEEYQKMNQAYMDLITSQLKKSGRVTKASSVPDLLITKPLTYTSIREASVRMQSDVAVIFTITTDTYSKYKFLSKADFKCFANTQLVILDIRTGLILFTSVVTKDAIGQKKENELDNSETIKRIQYEAALLTLDEIGQRINEFLAVK